jgi:hypothetical protein
MKAKITVEFFDKDGKGLTHEFMADACDIDLKQDHKPVYDDEGEVVGLELGYKHIHVHGTQYSHPKTVKFGSKD